jgi:hypothetical protein
MLESMSKTLARRRPANWAGAEDFKDALFAEALKTCARCTRCIEICMLVGLCDNEMCGEMGWFEDKCKNFELEKKPSSDIHEDI